MIDVWADLPDGTATLLGRAPDPLSAEAVACGADDSALAVTLVATCGTCRTAIERTSISRRWYGWLTHTPARAGR